MSMLLSENPTNLRRTVTYQENESKEEIGSKVWLDKQLGDGKGK